MEKINMGGKKLKYTLKNKNERSFSDFLVLSCQPNTKTQNLNPDLNKQQT